MSKRAKTQPGAVASAERRRRGPRSDTARNLQAVLEAATTVFASAGIDAPVRAIAEEAGVGTGTVYRHFPQRSDLIIAVFRHEVDGCANAAPVLAARYAPLEALERWIARYVTFLRAKRGLAAALHSGDPAYKVLPGYFKERLRPALLSLLESAEAAGRVRAGVDPDDLLLAIACLCVATPEGSVAHAPRLVAMFVDGLRSRART